MTLKKSIKIILCLILLFIDNAAAQPVTGSLSGRISKFYGEPVPEAKITIKLNSKKTRFAKTTISDASGEYRFSGIPPGSYRVSVSGADGMTFENPNFQVSVEPARLDIKLEYGGDCSYAGVNPLILSDADKARIVNDILRDVLSKGSIDEFARLKSQRAGIVLASENIKAEWLKPLKNIKINVFDSAEIRRQAESGGEFLYLSFNTFRPKGNCVVVALNNLWASPLNSRKAPVTGGGRIFVYGKKGNKFRLKTSGSWKF
jgi:hypothetical protein